MKISTLTTLLFFIMGFSNISANSTLTYKFGVFPHLPITTLEKVFSPMASEFSNVLDKKVEFRTATTFQNFYDAIIAEKWRIVLVQPFDYIKLHDELGYIPLAARDEPLEAIITTKFDSGINSIKDLIGKKISLPPETAAVSYLVKRHLIENGIIPNKDVTILHKKSHISCLQQVIIKYADACGTARPPWRIFQAKMKTKLKIIDKTKSIPHTLFAVHPSLPEVERQLILKEILSWGNTDAGKKLLERGKLKTFKIAHDKDYDVVRDLRNQKN